MSSYNHQNDYNSSTTDVCCEYEPLSEMNKLSSTNFSSSKAFKFSSGGGGLTGRKFSMPVQADTNKAITLDGVQSQMGRMFSVAQERPGTDSSDYVTM